jgi:hypothetical protein
MEEIIQQAILQLGMRLAQAEIDRAMAVASLERAKLIVTAAMAATEHEECLAILQAVTTL